MKFGRYGGIVLHLVQPDDRQNTISCGKCLEVGHTFKDWRNDWKCASCDNYGHIQIDCLLRLDPEMSIDTECNDADESGAESAETENDVDEKMNQRRNKGNRVNKSRTKIITGSK